MRRDRTERAIRARDEVLEAAARFAEVAEPAIAEAVRRRFEAVLAGAEVDEATRRAIRATGERALRRGVAAMRERLADPELWLSPMTLREEPPPREQGWSDLVPEWLARLLTPSPPSRPRPDRLDDPSNRIWIALALVARALDPVLEELGLEPEPAPSLGGRYRLHPRTVRELDPTGRVARRWAAYRAAYGRFADLVEG